MVDEPEQEGQDEASNPVTSAQRLTELSADPHLRLVMASNPSAPVKLLEQLSQDQDEQVRQAVAGNPNTPWDILEHLAWEFPREFLANAVGPLAAFASTTCCMFFCEADAKTSAGAPCVICWARVELAPKLKVTVVPGFAAWNALPIAAKDSFRDAAASTVMLPCAPAPPDAGEPDPAALAPPPQADTASAAATARSPGLRPIGRRGVRLISRHRAAGPRRRRSWTSPPRRRARRARGRARRPPRGSSARRSGRGRTAARPVPSRCRAGRA